MVSVKDLVAARLYPSEEDVIQDALRHLLRSRGDLRIQVAVHRYQTEDISLAKSVIANTTVISKLPQNAKAPGTDYPGSR